MLQWRDKHEARTVDVWLYRQNPFAAVWSHGFPRIAEYTKDGREVREVSFGSHVCVEDPEILRRQSFRDRETGERDTPPKICPMCLLTEHVYQLVREGALQLTDQLFRIEAGPGSRDAAIIHAGGLYGGFKTEKLSDEERDAIREAGINLKEAWGESALSRCQYIFIVVDDENPDEGLQIAKESQLLGDKVREAINKERERRGPDKGNPILNPYPIRFKHFPAEKVFNKKYDAVALDGEPSESVLELITNGEEPDISRYVDPPNYRTLRAQLEQYALFELDWDAIFGPIEKHLDEAGFYVAPDAPKAEPAKAAPKPTPKASTSARKPERREQREEEPPKREERKPVAAAKPAATSGRRLAPKPEPEPAVDVEQPAEDEIPCDECGKMMPADASVCAHCGAQYIIDKPAAAAPKAAAKPAAGKPKPGAAKPKAPRGSVNGDPAGDSDVPF